MDDALLNSTGKKKRGQLVAWCVHDGSNEPGKALLVFARTRTQAKELAFKAGVQWDQKYIRTHWCLVASRCHRFDRFADQERVIYKNEDLPSDAPPFFNV